MGSALWPVLIGESNRDDAFEFAARHYDVDRARWDASLASFAERCLAAGLLERDDVPARLAGVPHARPLGRRAGTFAALFSILATKRALARDGLRATYERYAAFGSASAATPLDRALPGFTKAENLFISRRAPRDCLLRSLALYRYLRAADVPVQHVIGVQRLPFIAHAWVEYEGVPVFDSLAKGFSPISRIGSPAPT